MLNSVYIHIPFCSRICSYCDFSKVYYNKNMVDNYLDSLEKEIESNYKNETIKTIYIGGGSPSSLSLGQLKKLFDIVKVFKFYENFEFTIELNVNDINNDKIKILKDNKVNRVSIGIQTFNKELLKILNRKHSTKEVKDLIYNLKKNSINNINIDLMYGLKEQSIKSIEKDLDIINKLDINHISCYSLILEPNTKLYVDNYQQINEDLELEQYDYIKRKISNMGFNHYEISNYAKEGYESKHNLVYWNNDKYYGFGLGACGYIDNYRYENTKNINKYINGNYLLSKTIVSEKEDMDNEIMLGLRKLKGIDKNVFKYKYNNDIHNMYNLTDLINKKVLIEDENNIYISDKYLYVSNEVIGKVLYGKSEVV